LRDIANGLRDFHRVELGDNDTNYASVFTQKRATAVPRLHWRSSLYRSAIIS
jgi:hypothetical protein